ncbi:MAG: hypothetical protein C0617_03170 [Desulfuromonas sp.]|nr:MAG: hypothetical protein C0617_03170 [Desulfuromonas sp.]
MLTPPVDSGLLPGTYRCWLLRKGTLREETVTVEMLRECEQIWLINSVRKWRKAVLADEPVS